MSIKDLLVVLESADAADALGSYAHSLADAFDAHLTVCGVIAKMPPAPAFLGEYPFDLVQSVQAAATREIEQAYDRFAKAAPKPDGVQLIKVEAAPSAAAEAVARLARHYDLTVIQQPNADTGRGDPALVESVLFHSGRATIILPYIQRGPVQLGKVIVAWDGGAAAARAMGCAIPLLKRAGKVEVVTMTGGRTGVDLPGVDVTRHLARHGISAELKLLPKGEDVGALLLSYAADESADMLVMGGYGHSRLREFVLGGATRTILQTMTLPIFMAH